MFAFNASLHSATLIHLHFLLPLVSALMHYITELALRASCSSPTSNVRTFTVHPFDWLKSARRPLVRDARWLAILRALVSLGPHSAADGALAVAATRRDSGWSTSLPRCGAGRRAVRGGPLASCRVGGAALEASCRSRSCRQYTVHITSVLVGEIRSGRRCRVMSVQHVGPNHFLNFNVNFIN
jgi:hypothetical protein